MKTLNIFKALANTYRLRIINLLLRRKFCVCQLEKILEISQPAVSRHLKKLTNAGIINFKTDGKYYCYFVEKNAIPIEILTILNEEFEKEIYKNDVKRSKNIKLCII